MGTVKAPTPIQERLICCGFLKSHVCDQYTNAIEAAVNLRAAWGIRIDWHVMSDVLDAAARHATWVERKGTGPDRIARYYVHRPCNAPPLFAGH